MSNLFTAQFWFNQYPDVLIPPMARLLLIIIALFIVSAVVFFFLNKHKGFFRKLWEKIMYFSVFNAIVGALLYFFSQQLIPFLSARLWFAVWGIEIIVWAIFIIVYAQQLPDKKKKLMQEKEFKKYIP
jgi:hypothetical protein